VGETSVEVIDITSGLVDKSRQLRQVYRGLPFGTKHHQTRPLGGDLYPIGNQA
jgi:hypothetical protein